MGIAIALKNKAKESNGVSRVVREGLSEMIVKQETEWGVEPCKTEGKECEVHVTGAEGGREETVKKHQLFFSSQHCEYCPVQGSVPHPSNTMLVEVEVVQDWGRMWRHMSPEPEKVLPPPSQYKVPGPFPSLPLCPLPEICKGLGEDFEF